MTLDTYIWGMQSHLKFKYSQRTQRAGVSSSNTDVSCNFSHYGLSWQCRRVQHSCKFFNTHKHLQWYHCVRCIQRTKFFLLNGHHTIWHLSVDTWPSSEWPLAYAVCNQAQKVPGSEDRGLAGELPEFWFSSQQVCSELLALHGVDVPSRAVLSLEETRGRTASALKACWVGPQRGQILSRSRKFDQNKYIFALLCSCMLGCDIFFIDVPARNLERDLRVHNKA